MKHRRRHIKSRSSRSHRKIRKTRKQRVGKQRGGSVLNAPNGSVVIVRDKGDKYSPFVAIDKQEAEEADF
jgi:hypothetical protein